MSDKLILHTYWRSSAAYRVRIALNIKGAAYASMPVSLIKGEQRASAYLALNPQGLVPMLEAGGGRMGQSLAILEYLEERFPAPPLLPTGAEARAHVRAMAQVLASDTHPLTNLRVTKYLAEVLQADEAAKQAWIAHWMTDGLQALEALALPHAGDCLFGDAVTMADCCLVPQLYSARRFGVPLEAFPTLLRAEAHCLALPAFDAARPEKQADAVL
jgi:maleylacetoacetate isomerase